MWKTTLTAVNGQREARGDIKVKVNDDAQPKVTFIAPAGPVTIGSDIGYTELKVCNIGQRPLTPVGTESQVYVVIPIPLGTTLKSGQTLPAGTQYSTASLATPPYDNLTGTPPSSAAMGWTSPAPALNTVKRIRIPVGASVAAGTCSADFSFIVTVNADTNANAPIYEIVDVFGNNSIGTTLTDQSGDDVASRGDGNANFNEPLPGDTSTTQGIQQQTLLTKTGNVLIGPSGAAGATGPNNNNDDFTNKSVNTGIATVASDNNIGTATPGTTAPGTVIFTNTIQNTGNANDTFTLTAPTVPTGFTVRISTNTTTPSYITVSGGGSTTIAIPVGETRNILVEITSPAGKTILTGYNSVIRATSGNTASNFNETIDRLYTGFIRLDKSFTVTNGTGVGGDNDPVPGAVITYTIAYSNIASVLPTGGTSGNVTLNASNFVITENGTAGDNNWGTFTTQVVGSASDKKGTAAATTTNITGDSAGSNVLTDTVGTLNAGESGVFTFKRTIR